MKKNKFIYLLLIFFLISCQQSNVSQEKEEFNKENWDSLFWKDDPEFQEILREDSIEESLPETAEYFISSFINTDPYSCIKQKRISMGKHTYIMIISSTYRGRYCGYSDHSVVFPDPECKECKRQEEKIDSILYYLKNEKIKN